MSGLASNGTPLLRLNEAVTGSPTRSGLTPDFELFPCGYRVVPIPNRNGQPPKSSKSAAPAIAVARRVGALLPEGHFYDFAARHTGSPLPSRATTSCGRLRRLPDTTPYRENALGATSGQCWPGRLQKLQTSEVLTTRAPLQIRPRSRLRTPPSFVGIPPGDCCTCHQPESQPHRPTLASCSGPAPFALPGTGSHIGP
jgi:hypothetical protein